MIEGWERLGFQADGTIKAKEWENTEPEEWQWEEHDWRAGLEGGREKAGLFYDFHIVIYITFYRKAKNFVKMEKMS